MNGWAFKSPPFFPLQKLLIMEFIQKKGIAHNTIWDNWVLIIWAALALVHICFNSLNGIIQIILFTVSILLVGIPHGALDHLIEEKNNTRRKQKFSMARFLGQYLVRMAIFALLWYWIPMVALALFLLLSAYHFGETDLAPLPFKGIVFNALRISYGLMILSFMLLTHINEVIPIINELPQLKNNNLIFYATEFRVIALALISALTIILGFILYLKDDAKNRPEYLGFIFQLMCILWIMISLPLILAFTFYFGCWHSLHSLNYIRHHLSDRPDQPLHWQELMRKSLPFSIAALAMIVLVVVWAGNTYDTPILMMGFFIGIAILTAPHLEIMSKMYRNKNV
jgi:Brp/Blh family beta-carotene 15,15'-monooxygenase